jgi:Xaa-Pro aminopeptidase
MTSTDRALTDGPTADSTALSERLNTPISTTELERRWTAVREAMEAADLDVLVIQNNSEAMGGYVRWFTDVPGFQYPLTVILPREGKMRVVTHGAIGARRHLGPEGDGVFRGVSDVLTTASFSSAAYTREYDARLAASALEPFAAANIGLVGTYQMGYAFGAHLVSRFQRANFSEASELVDQIKAIKSPDEQALIRATAALQDEVLQIAVDAVQPGRRESQVMAIARQAAQERGSEAGLLLCGSGPVGKPALLARPHSQNRELCEGDIFVVLVEVDGPGGLYTEVGRVCTIGPAPAQLKEEFAFALEAQQFTVSQMRPGASASEIFESYNEFMREHGRPTETRIHSHGQGYDLVERPLIRFDETMTIEAGMNMACHPTYMLNGVAVFVCDNWIIGPNGAGERLHAFPQEILEIV